MERVKKSHPATGAGALGRYHVRCLAAAVSLLLGLVGLSACAQNGGGSSASAACHASAIDWPFYRTAEELGKRSAYALRLKVTSAVHEELVGQPQVCSEVYEAQVIASSPGLKRQTVQVAVPKMEGKNHLGLSQGSDYVIFANVTKDGRVDPISPGQGVFKVSDGVAQASQEGTFSLGKYVQRLGLRS